MEVNGPGPIRGPLPIDTSHPAAEVTKIEQTRSAATNDELDISAAGKMLEHLQQSSQVRAERVAQIKAAIEAGEYETPEKLEAALEKLLDEIGAGE